MVAVNAVTLLVAVFLFARSMRDVETGDVRYVRTMRTMGLVFVAVAFYRSIFVSGYLHQLAWFDTVWNSSLLIRSFAIFAELSFAGLIAKTLLRVNHDVPELAEGHGPFRTFLQTKTPIVLFVCIATAQVFATTATITKVQLLFALEETCWGLGFLSILPMLFFSLRALRRDRKRPRGYELRQLRRAVVVLTVFAVGYAFFEIGFNLPVVQWPEAITQLQAANPDPAFRFGAAALRDAFQVVHQTRSLDDWGGLAFVVWDTGYFSICVWIVLFLMTGPRRLRAAVTRGTAPASAAAPATTAD
jgi:hypothetical protein